MRDIKFRGKDLETNQWVFGNLTQFNSHYPTISWYDNTYPVEKEHNCVVYPETVSQFIGKKDKNRAEIYEGDILRSVVNPDIILYIEYDAKEAAYMAVQINKYTGTDFESRCHITDEWLAKFPKEIIGNIHDNKGFINKEE